MFKLLLNLFLGFVAAILIYVFAFGFPFQFEGERHEPLLKEAQNLYRAAEEAVTVNERKELFNQALEKYLVLEKAYQPVFGNGKLFYNIGNTYYQLEEYPLSILYFERAKKLNPRNLRIQENLSIAQNKIQLPNDPFSPSFYDFSFFSLSEKLFFLGVLALILTLMGSLWIWKQKKMIASLSLPFIFLFLLIGVSVMYTAYISPVYGILIKATSLYRDAGEQYAPIAEKPFPPGSKAEVLDQKNEGRWLKVRMQDKTIGYTSLDTIRLI